MELKHSDMKFIDFLEKYEPQLKVGIVLGLSLMFMGMTFFYGHN
jgi:hypothetical protein